jgi:membrane fusion protein, heavy metal efflux system
MNAKLHMAIDKFQRAKSTLVGLPMNRHLQKINTAIEYLKSTRKSQILSTLGVVALGGAAWLLVASVGGRSENGHVESLNHARQNPGTFSPTLAQWSTLTVVPVTQRIFRSEHVTEGKIAVNEDRSTLIFSPYSGRVTKLLVKPGATVERGQPLFVIEAADMVQAQNDFIATLTAMYKARAQLKLAEAVERRHRDLYNDKAVALRELEQAQAALNAAQNDVRSSDTALEAGRNRLRILGKSDEEIGAFEQTGKISAETPIYAPIDGTIVQRKIGPGQYVNAGASEPVFVLGDLSTVWLVAFVRETEASKIHIDQQINFTVLTQPDEIYRGNIAYIAATLDPNTRRLMVRATIENPRGALKPEMFSSVSIFTDEGDLALAVPRDAVIYEGDTARVWVAGKDRALALRKISVGVTDGGMVQVLSGLKPGEEVVTKGSLFIDRAAIGS